MNPKTSPVKKRLSVLFIAICSSLLLFLLAKNPASDLYFETRELQTQLKMIRQEKEELLIINEETVRIFEEEALTSSEQDRLALSIPLEKDLPIALANLEKLVKQYPLNLNTLKTAPHNLQEVTGKMEVELGISGTVEEVDLFLSQVNSLPHLFKLDSITWNSAGDEKENAELFLVLEFYFVDPHELDAGKAHNDF